MRLQLIGEIIKKISDQQPDFFEKALSFDTNNIIRFSDFISHHYEKLDTDIVYIKTKNRNFFIKQQWNCLIQKGIQ